MPILPILCVSEKLECLKGRACVCSLGVEPPEKYTCNELAPCDAETQNLGKSMKGRVDS